MNDLEKIRETRKELAAIRERLATHTAKNRFWSLCQTKLQEFGHWLDDLAEEAEKEQMGKLGVTGEDIAKSIPPDIR